MTELRARTPLYPLLVKEGTSRIYKGGGRWIRCYGGVPDRYGS